MIRYDALEALPVRTALPALREALDGHGTAVLVAPPGTGKTTLVPLVLAGLVGEGPARRVVVAEPRRIAARAAARRMAWLLGEPVGGSVGYTVRGERVVGRHARVEVVTTGVLLQRLQRDQELGGVDVVVLDECHERHLDADTVAAFLWDVREALRPELRLVAASATTDAQGWARLLGGAPVVAAEGVSHPVEVVWAPPARPVRPPHGMRVDPALLSHVASVVRRALAERAGDVLCFLPGVGEIARVAGRLGDLGDVEVLHVHGRAPADVQDAVLSAGGAAPGGAGDLRGRVVPDRPGGAGGRRRGAGARAAGGPRARAERADDGAGLAGGRAAAGGACRAGGPRGGVPVLGGGRGRASAAVPGAGDPGGRPDGVRVAGGLLGGSGGVRAGPAGPAAGRGDGGGAGRTAGGGGRSAPTGGRRSAGRGWRGWGCIRGWGGRCSTRPRWPGPSGPPRSSPC
ncbi:hypothetical protein GCM10020295_63170 [Streptomyces cinereospinus]